MNTIRLTPGTPDYAKALKVKERVSAEAERLAKLDESPLDARHDFPGQVEIYNQATTPYGSEKWTGANLSFDPQSKVPSYMESKLQHPADGSKADSSILSLLTLNGETTYSAVDKKPGRSLYQIVQEDLTTHDLTYFSSPLPS